MFDYIILSKGFAKLSILFKHVGNEFKLEQQFGSLQQAKDLAKLRLAEAAYVRKCSSSIGLIVKSEFIKKDIGYGNLLELPVFIARSSKDSQFIYNIGKLARYDVWDAKHPTQQESGEFNIEQRFGGLQHVRDFAKLKLAGGAYIKRCFGSIVLLKKHAKDNPVGDFNANMNGDAFVKTENIIEAKAGVSAGGPAVSGYALGSGMSIHNQRCRASKRVYSQKYKVGGNQGAGILRQQGELDAMGLECSLGQLYSDVSKMEEPGGLMLIEYNGYISKYKAVTYMHSQGFNAKELTHYEKYGNVFRHAYVRKNVKDTGLNILLKHTNDKLKLSEGAYDRKFSISIGLIVKSEFIRKGLIQATVNKSMEQQFGGLLQARDFAKFKLSDPVCVKRRYKSIRFINKSAMAGQLGYDIGKLAEHDVKHATQQEYDKFKWKQQLGDPQQTRDLAEFMLLGTIYVKECFGRFMLIARSVSVKKGVWGSNLLEQYAYIIKNQENTVPLVKNSKLKMTGAICLKEVLGTIKFSLIKN